MTALLTEVAIQLKGSLAFLLGLGGMFTTVKALVTGLFLLPRVTSDRSSIRTGADRLRLWLGILAAASGILFVAALWLYFGTSIAAIDADKLKAATQVLSKAQRWTLGWLIIVSLALVVAEGASSVVRQRLSELLASAK